MHRYEHRFTAMGGPCQIRLDSDDENQAMRWFELAEAEVRRLDRKYSSYLDDSVVSQVNAGAGSGTPTTIDQETKGLLDYADSLWRESDGLFDITSGPLLEIWDFRQQKLPEESAIADALEKVGWEKVKFGEDSIALPLAGMSINLGGYAKEYACDAVRRLLNDEGCQHALIELAGDISICGLQHNGEPWKIGIRHPAEPQKALAEISLKEGGLASSGDYERSMTIEGKRYGHILNPKTGLPLESLASVSIVAEQCLIAGSLATLALLKSPDDSLSWLASLGVPWLAVDQDMQVHGSIKNA